MSRSRIILLALLLGALALLAVPTAAQPLPGSLWYAVVYNPTANTLHWITPAGEQASLPRPLLPDEQPGAQPRIAISPNGRYGVIAAPLTNNNEGLGIYDFATGAFVQTHQAAPGEQIVMPVYDAARRFNLTSTRAAVSFFSGNLQTPINWRVIVFDLASGSALTQLMSAGAGVAVPPGTFPEVVYYDVDEGFGTEVIHFRMIPLTGDDSAIDPTFAWYHEGTPPGLTGSIVTSGYWLKGDINILSGEAVFTYTDTNYGTLPFDGLLPNDNAVGHSIPDPNQFSPTLVWIDGTRYNSQARWATSGQWILYFSDDGGGNRHWNVIQTSGTPTNNTRTPLGYDIIDAHGVTDGFITLSNDNVIRHAMMFPLEPYLNEVGSQIFAANAIDPLRIVYVTPPGMQFALQNLGGGGGVVQGADDLAPPPVPPDPPQNPPDDFAPPQPTLTPTSELEIVGVVLGDGNCSSAPQQRLQMGAQFRTNVPDGTLAMRHAPTDEFPFMQIGHNLTGTVIAGPVCHGGYRVWRVALVQNGQAVEGWLNEGTPQRYFLDPLP